MRNYKPLALILMAALTILGCSPDAPTGNTSSGVKVYSGELSKADYDALSNQQKYQVANKLLGTMFKGVPVDEFLIYQMAWGV